MDHKEVWIYTHHHSLQSSLPSQRITNFTNHKHKIRQFPKNNIWNWIILNAVWIEYIPTVAMAHPMRSSRRPSVRALQAFQRQRVVTLPLTTCTFHWAPCGWYPRLWWGATDTLRRTVQLAPINAPWCMI